MINFRGRVLQYSYLTVTLWTVDCTSGRKRLFFGTLRTHQHQQTAVTSSQLSSQNRSLKVVRRSILDLVIASLIFMRCFTDKNDETDPGSAEASEFLDQFEIGKNDLQSVSIISKYNSFLLFLSFQIWICAFTITILLQVKMAMKAQQMDMSPNNQERGCVYAFPNATFEDITPTCSSMLSIPPALTISCLTFATL